MKKFFNHHDQEKQSPLLPSLPLSLSFPPPAKTKPPMSTSSSRYMECLKNHAAAIGGHALDGCGEFAPSGPDALTCGACNCHRNFHRKEPEAVEADAGPTGLEPLRSVNNDYPAGSNGQPVLFRFCPYEKTASYEEERKRFRTKFTAEQKEKMAEMAEKVGWRLKKDDEPVVQRFCRETGVSRRVFKVWMHNNKHTLAKRLP